MERGNCGEMAWVNTPMFWRRGWGSPQVLSVNFLLSHASCHFAASPNERVSL